MKKIALLILSLFVLVSCGNSNSTVNIINPDADFLYFYGATCPHCQDLNEKIKEIDLYSKVSVEKREVWYNKQNQALFYETAAGLWLKESELSVPFVYNKATWKHVVGTDDAFEMLTSWIAETSTGAVQ